MLAPCPSCKGAFAPETHPGGRCEAVNRGRRFFLMGALALPVAQKVTLAAPAVVPVLSAEKIAVYSYELALALTGDVAWVATSINHLIGDADYFALAK